MVRQVLERQERNGKRLSWPACLCATARGVAEEFALFYAGALLGGLGGEWLWYRGLCEQYWRLLLGGLLTTPENTPRRWYSPFRLLSAVCHLLFPLVNAPSALVPATEWSGAEFLSALIPPAFQNVFQRAKESSQAYVAPTSFAAKVAAQRWFEAREVEGRRACGASAGMACWLGWNTGRWVRHCWQWRRRCAGAVKALAAAVHQHQEGEWRCPKEERGGEEIERASAAQTTALAAETPAPAPSLRSSSSLRIARPDETDAGEVDGGGRPPRAAEMYSPPHTLLSPLLLPLPPPPPPPPVASVVQGVLMLATTAAHFAYIYALAANPVDIDVYTTATTLLPKPSPFGTSRLYWDTNSVASGWETLRGDSGPGDVIFASLPPSSTSSFFYSVGEGLQTVVEGLRQWWWRCWISALDRAAASAGVALRMGEVDERASVAEVRRRGKAVMLLLSSHAGHSGGFLVGVALGLLMPECGTPTE